MADTQWWQDRIIYQIYPSSFQDSNGDGVGDLDGITERLDYFLWLGVDALWICPFYPSPMADFGYDISDYRGVDPLFGDLESFDRLLAEAHSRGLRVILDFVPNHSSDRHPWFLESRSSRANPRRDWYIWRDPAADGGSPNNWLANFGGSAWTYDDATGQYYYHAFLPEQPDLNWRNPQVGEAMRDVLRFWLDRGVDGFRVDVLWHLIKDKKLRDNPPNEHWHDGMPSIDQLGQDYSVEGRGIYKTVSELRAVIDDYPNRVLIGELYLPVDRLVRYYGPKRKGAKRANLAFNFQLIFTSWHAADIARMIAEYEAKLQQRGWPNWVLGNHDQKRIATRVGSAQAGLAAMLLLTLRGTPTLYYGDELGLQNVKIPPELVRDPWGKSEPRFGRDPQRTPMPWDDSENAGFTTGTPWLPLNPDFPERNVARLSADGQSILILYRRLIAIRRQSMALNRGAYVNAHTQGDVLVYERQHEGVRLLIGLNFSEDSQSLALPADAPEGRLIISSGLDRAGERISGAAELRPAEGVIVRLSR